jgi:hypothetical protein
MRSLSALLGATALLAALVFAGCGGTALDAVSLEEEVTEYVEKSLHEDVKSVDCPSGEPVDPGRVVKCEVVLKGGAKKVAEIEITDKKADLRVKHYGGTNE